VLRSFRNPLRCVGDLSLGCGINLQKLVNPTCMGSYNFHPKSLNRVTQEYWCWRREWVDLGALEGSPRSRQFCHLPVTATRREFHAHRSSPCSAWLAVEMDLGGIGRTRSNSTNHEMEPIHRASWFGGPCWPLAGAIAGAWSGDRCGHLTRRDGCSRDKILQFGSVCSSWGERIVSIANDLVGSIEANHNVTVFPSCSRTYSTSSQSKRVQSSSQSSSVI